MSESTPTPMPGVISNEEIQARAAAFRNKIFEEGERERKIIEKFGFSVHAHNTHAFTKGLKIDEVPTLLFAHCSLAQGNLLAPILGLLAAEGQQTKTFEQFPKLPYGIALDPSKPDERVALRVQVVEVSNEEFNEFTKNRGVPVAVSPDFKVYSVRIGDRSNLLPGEDGYTDIHQL